MEVEQNKMKNLEKDINEIDKERAINEESKKVKNMSSILEQSHVEQIDIDSSFYTKMKKEISIEQEMLSDEHALNELMRLINYPADILLRDQKNDDKDQLQKEMIAKVSKFLFSRVEALMHDYNRFLHDTGAGGRRVLSQDTELLHPLSGIEGLCISKSVAKSCVSTEGEFLDIHPVWGQVELQTKAMFDKLNEEYIHMKKMVKKRKSYQIPRLFCDDDDGEKDEIFEVNDNKTHTKLSKVDGEGSCGEDEMLIKMRERMERSMASAEDDGIRNNDEISRSRMQSKENDEDSLTDQAATELNDGFFNLKELESFADEEEEYHEVVKNSEHESRDINEGFGKIKKYRDEEDISFLDKMYENSTTNDDDIKNMTALDFFGKPNKSLLESNLNPVEFKDVGPTLTNDEDRVYPVRSLKSKKEIIGQESETKYSAKKKEIYKDSNPLSKHHKTYPSASTEFSRKQEILNTQTERLERDMLAEKPWQMKGEAKSSMRPINSLLESTPEFEVACKIAPVITLEHTSKIEQMIKNRIIAEDWDDVIPRELPDILRRQDNREAIDEVSQEKSKLGLGELYERDYLKKAIGYDVDKVEKDSSEVKAKNEMKMIFANICSKLDALSNYHFTPRPIIEDVEGKHIEKPAITMEEVIPVHVCDNLRITPGEVYDGGIKRGKESILKSESELSQRDRKSIRSTKKAARRKARKQKLADQKLVSRLQPSLTGLNNPYEKRKIMEDLSLATSMGKIISSKVDRSSNFKTSTAFFKKMQDETKRDRQFSSIDISSKKRKTSI